MRPGRFSRLTKKREQFFEAFKRDYANLYAIYLMMAIVGVWSGVWYLVEAFSWGQWLAPPGHYTLTVSIRHGAMLLLGCAMLYLDDGSLQELVLMSKTESDKPIALMTPREKLFHNLKRRYPSAMAIYTILGIIFAWCGTWGLLWDIPLHPGGRSLLTIGGGLLMLYIDDLKLDEI